MSIPTHPESTVGVHVVSRLDRLLQTETETEEQAEEEEEEEEEEKGTISNNNSKSRSRGMNATTSINQSIQAYATA
jgi:hypothetical protein